VDSLKILSLCPSPNFLSLNLSLSLSLKEINKPLKIINRTDWWLPEAGDEGWEK